MVRIFTVLALAVSLGAASFVSASAQSYGYGAPSGSYQQSCNNVRMRGSILSASCSSTSGQQVYSSLDLSRCRGGDIANSNGYLTCNGSGNYNGGYYNNGGYNNRGYNDDDDNNNNNNGHHHHHHNGNAYGYGNGNGDGDRDDNGGRNGYGYGSVPSGSYQQSCSNIQMRGSTLSASCNSPSGHQVYSSLNVSRCSSDIRNQNGYLRCQ